LDPISNLNRLGSEVAPMFCHFPTLTQGTTGFGEELWLFFLTLTANGR
jgi:hypothetical protein